MNYRILAVRGAEIATRKFVDMVVPSPEAALRVKEICEKNGYSAAIIPTALPSTPVQLPLQLSAT